MIYVKDLKGNTLTIDVEQYDTIAEIKQNIYHKNGIHESYQLLIWNGIHLDNYKTINYYGIKHESTFFLVVKPGMDDNVFKIYVKDRQERTFTINVESSNNIEEIKKKIFVERRIPIAEQTLVGAGQKLEDYLTLKYYQIKKESTIFLVLTPLPFPTFDIFLKDLKGNQFLFKVKISDTIEELKYKIFDKIGRPVKEQRLVFRSKVLTDDFTIGKYDIQQDDTIHLTLYMLGD